jgi:hypothetical protein
MRCLVLLGTMNSLIFTIEPFRLSIVMETQDVALLVTGPYKSHLTLTSPATKNSWEGVSDMTIPSEN